MTIHSPLLKCQREKLSKYRPGALTDPNYWAWADEAIEEDYS